MSRSGSRASAPRGGGDSGSYSGSYDDAGDSVRYTGGTDGGDIVRYTGGGDGRDTVRYSAGSDASVYGGSHGGRRTSDRTLTHGHSSSSDGIVYGGSHGGPRTSNPTLTHGHSSSTDRRPLTRAALYNASGGTGVDPPLWSALKPDVEDLYARRSGNGRGKQREGTHDPFPISTHSDRSISRDEALGTRKRSPVANNFWGANPYGEYPYGEDPAGRPSQPKPRVGDDLPNERSTRIRQGPRRNVRVTEGTHRPSASAVRDDVRDEPHVRTAYAESDAEEDAEPYTVQERYVGDARRRIPGSAGGTASVSEVASHGRWSGRRFAADM